MIRDTSLIPLLNYKAFFNLIDDLETLASGYLSRASEIEAIDSGNVGPMHDVQNKTQAQCLRAAARDIQEILKDIGETND